MKLQITFLNSFHAFCKSGAENEKIIKVKPGSYLVECFEKDSSFYNFSHPTFHFQLSKKTWDSGEFLKIFKAKVLIVA